MSFLDDLHSKMFEKGAWRVLCWADVALCTCSSVLISHKHVFCRDFPENSGD